MQAVAQKQKSEKKDSGHNFEYSVGSGGDTVETEKSRADCVARDGAMYFALLVAVLVQAYSKTLRLENKVEFYDHIIARFDGTIHSGGRIHPEVGHTQTVLACENIGIVFDFFTDQLYVDTLGQAGHTHLSFTEEDETAFLVDRTDTAKIERKRDQRMIGLVKGLIDIVVHDLALPAVNAFYFEGERSLLNFRAHLGPFFRTKLLSQYQKAIEVIDFGGPIVQGGGAFNRTFAG